MIPSHLFLISREIVANFTNQSQSVVKQNQSKREITLDAQLTTVLIFELLVQFVDFSEAG